MLAGREIAMRLRSESNPSWKRVLGLVTKDMVKVAIGLGVSIVLALIINTGVRNEVVAKYWSAPPAAASDFTPHPRP